MAELTLQDFNTIEKVRSLFESVGYIGEKNCFLVALNRNYLPKNTGFFTSAMALGGFNTGGFVGGLTGAIIGKSVEVTMAEARSKITDRSIFILTNTSDICGYVMNKTEKGYGFIPLSNNYSLITKLEEVKAHPDFFASVTYDQIDKSDLKKIAFNFNRRILQMGFKCESQFAFLTLTIYAKHKLIPYQEEQCKLLLEEGV